MLRTRELIAIREVRLVAKKALVVLVIAIGLPGSLMLMASAANAQEPRTATSMTVLKEKTAKLGAPKIEGTEVVGNKLVPVLYFGSTKMNDNFTVVDEVAKGRRARNGGHTVRKGRRRIAERNASRPRFRLPAYPIVTSHLRSPSLWIRSPHELGLSEDTRSLGLGLVKLSISPAEEKSNAVQVCSIGSGAPDIALVIP